MALKEDVILGSKECALWNKEPTVTLDITEDILVEEDG